MRDVFERLRVAYRAAQKENRAYAFDAEGLAITGTRAPDRDLAAFNRALGRRAVDPAASSVPAGAEPACWAVICRVRLAIGFVRPAPSLDVVGREARERLATDFGHLVEQLRNDPTDGDPPVASGLTF